MRVNTGGVSVSNTFVNTILYKYESAFLSLFVSVRGRLCRRVLVDSSTDD